MKFSTKLAALSMGIVLVSSAVLAYFGHTTTVWILEDQIKEKLEEHAFHVMDGIDRMLFERYADMKALAVDSVISSPSSTSKQITKTLTAFLNSNKFYTSLSMFDLNRIRTGDTSGRDLGRQHPFTEYWPAIAEGRDFVLVIAESQTLKKVVLYFASIVKDKNGTPFGVVVSRIPVEKLHEIISQAEGVNHGKEELKISLVDRNGLLLYSNAIKGILTEVSPDWEFVKGLLTAGTKVGSARHQYSGEDEISTFAREQGYLDFKGNDWTLIICTPAQTAFAPAREMAKRMGTILFIIGGCVLLIALVFSRTVSKPIEKLSAAATEIGKGNLDVTLDVASRDEIGQLARTFKTMAADLKRDIIERKQAEDEICKLNEELELKVAERTRQLLDAQEELVRKEKLSILGQLSGSVGHELRNPLGVISNAVYFLKTVLSGADETVKEYLGIIKGEVDNSLRIINDLLDFSRTKTPQVRSIAVSELARNALEKCSMPPGVSVKVDIPDALPAVRIDPLQMGQVFQNLITNAVQAMPDGGVVRVSARRVGSQELGVRSNEVPELRTLNAELDRDFVEISVADTGEGISPDNMKKLFQPLFTTKARGIGLGLVVSKNLVEANGGMIEVDSETGRGTRFKVILPGEN